MRPSNSWHPEADWLKQFSLGRLSDTDSAVVELHLADCPPCCDVLASLDDRDGFLSKLQAVGRCGPAYPDVPGYEILGFLGHGGMGVVYRARQLKANRLVALKMIRAVEHATPQARLRFQIETEAVARLQHPHIVQLYDAGEVRGQPFFSLEFCDGGRLSDQIAKQRPSPREAAELIATLARAMHYAHLRGVVHRDLKPGNVLLAGAGRLPKIADFGLAKLIDAETREVSKSGAIMGTVAYMAPEQAAGKVHDTGPAADVYALGALLYECLTGRPPFEGPQQVVLARVLNDGPVPPSRILAQTPRDLETVCLKCLNKDPARRYASAADLADDLQRFLDGEPIRARPAGAAERAVKWARRHAPVAALAAAVLLVAALGLAGIVWKYLDAERQRVIARENEAQALKEAEKANKARDFLVSIFRLSETDVRGGNIPARQILADAEKRIPEEFADQPALRADLEKAIGSVKRGIALRVPHAMILEVRGTVRLQSAKGVNKATVPQALLNLDDRLTLSADGQVRLVILSDLHQERLKSGREATVKENGCEPADAVLERDDDILMTFVRLPKGTFYMGWNGKKKGVKREIKEDFEIAVHDVTQGQWEAVMGNNPSSFSRMGDERNSVLDVSDEELKLFPVERVTWSEVQEFIKTLNEKERGRGWLYRLPTEAEWEYACRGGATSEEECSYHFYIDKPTNDLSSKQANINGKFPFGNAPKGQFLGRPSRVGAYPPNKLGLCDMHGNVWQWCADLYHPPDPQRVSRGGSWWFNGGAGALASYRAGDRTDAVFYDRGFRLVRVPVR
jgi:formylglycine-generating enzyme required for sulfatase activity/tRNA A-37 threonylcarbamoyl transferase component Bud32